MFAESVYETGTKSVHESEFDATQSNESTGTHVCVCVWFGFFSIFHQTTAGNLLTMMETTPGNYQLVTTTTTSIMKPGTSLAAIQPGLISVTNTANHQTAHKNLVPKLSPLKLVGHNMPVTTLEEDSE